MASPNTHAEWRHYMATHYELVSVNNTAFVNRNKTFAGQFSRTYHFGHYGRPGVNLERAHMSSRFSASDVMDDADKPIVYRGPKLMYRLQPEGYQALAIQKHAQRITDQGRRPITYREAVLQVALLVKKYIVDVGLRTVDRARLLNFHELYLLRLEQQGGSFVVVLAYYGEPSTDIPRVAEPVILPPLVPSNPIIIRRSPSPQLHTEPTPFVVRSFPGPHLSPQSAHPRRRASPRPICVPSCVPAPSSYTPCQSDDPHFMQASWDIPIPTTEYAAESTPYSTTSRPTFLTEDPWTFAPPFPSFPSWQATDLLPAAPRPAEDDPFCIVPTATPVANDQWAGVDSYESEAMDELALSFAALGPLEEDEYVEDYIAWLTYWCQ